MVNCRKTGTGESLAGIAEYIYVFILFTLTFENWNKPSLNTISFIIEWNESRKLLKIYYYNTHYFVAWIIVLLFD